MIFYNKKKVYYSLYILFVLVLNYAIQDFQTSNNTGGFGLDRSLVHISLFCILFFLAVYFVRSMALNWSKSSAINSVLWLITGWILLSNLFQDEIDWSMAVQLGLCLLWALVYYLFSSYLQHFPDAWPVIQKGILMMFGFYCFSTVYSSYTIRTSYQYLVAINLVYSAVVFLPWLTFVSSRIKRVFYISIVFFLVLSSVKRGALLVFPIMLSGGLFVDALGNYKLLKTAFRNILTLVLFFVGIKIADDATGGYMFDRFSSYEMTSGSGRIDIYGVIIDSLSQSSPWTLLVGHGSGAVERLLGTAAHNEWLEFLYNFGAIGAFLYVLLFFTLVVRLRHLVKNAPRLAPGYAMAIVYMFIVGMFGQIYFAHSTLYIMAFLGTVEALMTNEEQAAKALVHSAYIK